MSNACSRCVFSIKIKLTPNPFGETCILNKWLFALAEACSSCNRIKFASCV